MNKNKIRRAILALTCMLTCALSVFGQTYRINRQSLSIEGCTFVHKAGVSNVNYLYMEDFGIARGETVSVPVYLHSTVPIWSWQADVVMPEGLTVLNAEFSNEFQALSCASEYSFDCGAVAGGFRLLAFNLAKTSSIPVVNKLHIATLTIKASETVTSQEQTAWLKRFYFVNANDNSGVQGADKSCTVSVAPIPVSSVTLDKSTAEMKSGETLALHATVLPEDATDRSLSWRSNNTAVATVNADGLVTAKAVGSATITATANDGSGKKATCRVTVIPTLVNEVIVSPSTLELEVGNTTTLAVAVLPATATNKVLSWTSSNTAVATVNNNGEVSAVGLGTAIITATATDGSGKSGSCQLTVKPVMVQSIVLNPTNAELNVGNHLTINAAVMPSNASIKTLSWRSSNATVATVSSNGVVSALSVGTARITATATDGSGTSATCLVRVIPIYVSSITLNTYDLSMAVGGTAELLATVNPANATDQSLEWSSSNTSVAVVSRDGLVTAKSVGTTVITVMAQDGSDVKAECQVTVLAQMPGKISTPELTVSYNQVGRILELPLTMTLPEGADFTNIELHFTFPEGLRPIADSDGVYGYEGVDIPFKGRLPVVNYADNFDVEENWPNYDVVGANVSLTPVTVNPCQLYTLHVTPESDFTPGDRQMLIYVKYTDSTNNSYSIGSRTSRVPLTTIHFSSILKGDVSGDGRVDINDVNAIVNIILDLKPRNYYSGDANVDGDERDRVDIDDVNQLVNIILSL